MDGGGSWDMVVSLLHRVTVHVHCFTVINWMNVYEEILDSTMLNV